MKKIVITSLFLLALASCSEELRLEPDDTSNEVEFVINASVDSTKTYLVYDQEKDAYKGRWSVYDEISLNLVNLETGQSIFLHAWPEILPDGRAVKFRCKASLGIETESSVPFKVWAEKTNSYGYGSVSDGCIWNQYPRKNSGMYDFGKDMLVSLPQIIDIDKERMKSPVEIDMKFCRVNHFFNLLCPDSIDGIDGLGNGDRVEKITLSVYKPGSLSSDMGIHDKYVDFTKYRINWDTAEILYAEQNRTHLPITLFFSGHYPYLRNLDVWFSAPPFILQDDFVFELGITLFGGKRIVKKISNTNREFRPGEITRLHWQFNPGSYEIVQADIIEQEVAGTLSEKYDYKKPPQELRIAGPIDGDDINYIRETFINGDFKVLDLSKARIVGGKNYDGSNLVIDDVVGPRMFSFPFYSKYNYNDEAEIILSQNIRTIGSFAFSELSFTGIEIPASVTKIMNSAFWRCHELVFVTFAGSMLEIGSSAFAECLRLNSITIPPGVKKISDKLFQGCTSLQYVNFDDNIETIGASSFMDCSAMEAFVVPSSVSSMGEYAFASCKNLKSLVLSPNCPVIPESCFESASSLEKVTIPAGVTAIEDLAFYDCSSLSEVELPETVESIGKHAFTSDQPMTIRCYATTPPSIYNTVVYKSFGKVSAVYVPKEALAKYTASSTWNSYKLIPM